MKKMTLRIDDMELRSCTENLLLDNIPHTTAEIIQWQKPRDEKEFCYTLAFWQKDSEGYDLVFVGSRPFQSEIDKNTFWKLAKIGQEFLDADFNS